MSKKAPKTKQIERQGIALIAGRIADLGHLWNETQNDVGIDGWLELVRRPAGEATGRIVLVQSKATGVAFAPEAPVTYVCREEDLRYWLNGNAPVILVRCHPASGEAYWVSVKDYFREHPEQRAARRIIFDREHDRFDADAGERLWQLGRPRHDGLHLGPPPVRETLTSNLLSVVRVPDVIFVAPARVRTHREARAALKSLGAPPLRAWMLRGGSVLSFHDPSSSEIGRLCAGPADALGSDEFSGGDDADRHRQFVHLLNGGLEEQLRPAARAGKNPHVLFLAAPRDLTPVELPGLGGQSRTVVKPYLRKDGSIRYVRHLAMERRFRRFGDTWYLEIMPTYFFSSDGWWESRFAAQHVAGIKRSERHADVRRHVQTWMWILRDEVDLGGLTPDPERQLMEFGQMAQVELDAGEQMPGDASDGSVASGAWEAA
jgi:hypothetical protein